MMLFMFSYRKKSGFYALLASLVLSGSFPSPVQAVECREDYHCVLVQDAYCRTIKSVPEKNIRKWKRENVREMAERAKAGYVCPPVLPSKLQIENHFPLCIAGTCVAGMIPGRE